MTRSFLLSHPAALASGILALAGLLTSVPSHGNHRGDLFHGDGGARRRLRRHHRHRAKSYIPTFFSDPKTVELRADLPSSVDLRTDSPGVGAAVCGLEDIGTLTSVLASDIQNLGLRPIPVPSSSSTNGHGEIIFGGLDADLVNRAFVGRRIALFGDSTTVHIYTRLNQLFTLAADSNQLLSTLATTTTYSAERRIDGEIGRMADKRAAEALKHPRASQVSGDIMFVRTNFDTEGEVLQTVVDFQPQVIIGNIGLHLLHNQNYGRDVNQVKEWLEYEQFLEKTVLAAEAAGAELLLFKTTNFICDEAYRSDWAVGNELYINHDEKTLNDCFNSFRAQNDPWEIKDEEIADYCRNGVINTAGADFLNQRLYRFVDEWNTKSIGIQSSLKIVVFNDHDIQSCKTTRVLDGRHHHMINLVRLRLLGNYLECLT